MTDLAKRASLGVRELQSTFQLGLHDAGIVAKRKAKQ